MAIHFEGRDKDGTHRISGSSEKKELPFKPAPQAIKATEGFGVGVIASPNRGKVVRKESVQLLIDDLVHQHGIGAKYFKLTGDFKYTDLSSFVVFRSGMRLSQNEFRLLIDSHQIEISSVTPSDTDLEVRSSVMTNRVADVIDDVLILRTDENLTPAVIKSFMPEIGDPISFVTTFGYDENKYALSFPIEEVLAAYIITCDIREDGLYGTVQVVKK